MYKDRFSHYGKKKKKNCTENIIIIPAKKKTKQIFTEIPMVSIKIPL